MAEAAEESTHVWSHKARIALFLSAMRHFRGMLRQRGWTVHYRELGERGNTGSLATELNTAIKHHRPEELVMVEAGEWRVAHAIKKAARAAGIPLEVRIDRHFLSTRSDFEAHAQGRKQLRMEFFYREMRRRCDVLMEGDQPVGGAWNFDAKNRESFGRKGPGTVPDAVAFPPDAITQQVLKVVEKRFADHPGSLEAFDWPVTREEARVALRDFIRHRLPDFGRYQDAMWAAPEDGLLKDSSQRRNAYLFHSRLSAAMNLKLLNPREAIRAAEKAFHAGRAPLPSVEGFIRQILGWREFVRGIYWLHMPGYLELNGLKAEADLPAFFWTGDTEMHCLRSAVKQTLTYGYAHHIQRLMVTGLFSLLLGVRPQEVHRWYLAVYVDAVEWVELPNTLGMSQYGDGGIMASKPYVATGKYIHRMSNYCAGCRFDPSQSTGETACPFTTLYWDFLLRHQKLLGRNPRMTLQLKNCAKLSSTDKIQLRRRASDIRRQYRVGTALRSVRSRE
jgi:deoxyribodipyrimidine photolyase-related protein